MSLILVIKYFVLLFALFMVNPDCFLKPVVYTDAKSVVVKEVDVSKQFTTKQ